MTFSLLPERLIPYRKYDIPTCLFIAEQRQSGTAMQDIASDLTAIFYSSSETSFSVAVVFAYLKLFQVASLRYRLFRKRELTAKPYIPEVQGACREFYAGIRFLFGIPSQGTIRDGP